MWLQVYSSPVFIVSRLTVLHTLLYLIVCSNSLCLFFLVFQCVMGNCHRHFYMEIKSVSSTEFSALAFFSTLIQLLLPSFFARSAHMLSWALSSHALDSSPSSMPLFRFSSRFSRAEAELNHYKDKNPLTTYIRHSSKPKYLHFNSDTWDEKLKGIAYWIIYKSFVFACRCLWGLNKMLYQQHLLETK